MKINLSKYILYAVCAGCFTTAGCNKVLDLKPSDFIDASKAYRNVADINMGLLGAYAAMGTSDITNTSLMSDEVMLPTENTTGRFVSTYRWQIDGSNSTITQGFGDYYVVIDRVNRVLDAIDNVTVGATEGPLKEQYRGELLALRAYCHFSLIRNFASSYDASGMGVPYMEHSVNSKPARPTVAETLAKAKADLDKAKTLIPAAFAANTRITLKAVSAIQARLALYEKNWQNAITYATEAITALPLAAKADFANIWLDKSEAEVLWKLKRVSGDGKLGDFYYDTKNIVLYAPSFELVNKFDSVNDVRFKAYIKYDKTRGTGKSQYLVNKYVGGNSALVNLADIKLFRTGEMYLIRAEAYAETGNLVNASADLNALRAARINGYSPITLASKDQAVTEIYTERYKELAFEGHRYYDLRRRNMNIDREPADAINALGSVLLTPNDAAYVLPIPNDELRANKPMVQNPKY